MEEVKSLNFIEEIITEDLESGKHTSITTRFPPEPNGYLHLGHAKSICLNFGLGLKYHGRTNLRFDDTNPTKEEIEYVDSIREDVIWLGFHWTEERFASDYFDQIFELTCNLIKKSLAYVDDSTSAEIAAEKGTTTQAGVNSKNRNRSVEENLRLFNSMRDGKFAEGSCSVRAKIDMSSSNMLMRDPVIYRIKFAHHHQTGDKWCIYPMYDYAHPISDALENVTHSLCTLEFVEHRPFYDWTIKNLDLFPSRQIEFARLNVGFTILSKSKLIKLVKSNLVNGWDDPRMPTISGMRRRGYTSAALRSFADRIGIAKRENLIDLNLLEHFVREDLNKTSHRLMAVLNPLKVVITNFEEVGSPVFSIENNPEDETSGTREVPMSSVVYIENDDFMEVPPKGYHRLSPNGLVRLKGAFVVQHTHTLKDSDGNIIEIHCKYVNGTRSDNPLVEVKVKAAVHWVAEDFKKVIECRLYDKLFTIDEPASDPEKEFTEFLNPGSLVTVTNACIEPEASKLKQGNTVQFMRHGYFCLDKDSTENKMVFNRTVSLKSSYKLPSVN